METRGAKVGRVLLWAGAGSLVGAVVLTYSYDRYAFIVSPHVYGAGQYGMFVLYTVPVGFLSGGISGLMAGIADVAHSGRLRSIVRGAAIGSLVGVIWLTLGWARYFLATSPARYGHADFDVSLQLVLPLGFLIGIAMGAVAGAATAWRREASHHKGVWD